MCTQPLTSFLVLIGTRSAAQSRSASAAAHFSSQLGKLNRRDQRSRQEIVERFQAAESSQDSDHCRKSRTLTRLRAFNRSSADARVVRYVQDGTILLEPVSLKAGANLDEDFGRR